MTIARLYPLARVSIGGDRLADPNGSNGDKVEPCSSWLCSYLAPGNSSPDRRLPLDVPASKAQIVLDRLSKSAGLELAASGSVRDDVLLLRVEGASVKETMDRIAQAVSGSWTRLANGRYSLGRAKSTERNQQTAELARRSDEIRHALTQMQGRYGDAMDLDASSAAKLSEGLRRELDRKAPTARLRVLVGQTPAHKAAIRLLATLDLQVLAQIPPHSRRVFSTAPNALQESLAPSARSIFNRFIAEEAAFSRAYRDRVGPVRRSISLDGMSISGRGPGDASKGLGLGLVALERRGDDDLQVQITAADPNLETVSGATVTLAMSEDPIAAGSFAGHPLKVPDAIVEMAKAFRNRSMGPEALRIFPARSGRCPNTRVIPSVCRSAPNSGRRWRILFATVL